ncbi:MAG: DUF3187 family protein [Spirochaetaceae bacterium]|jgi:hypothetical protein|nr:DUF3187 family protein [Spirochaetaceae bacterium]
MKKLFLSLAFVTIITPLFSQSLGPLSGSNLYLPHLPYLSFTNGSPLYNENLWTIEERVYWINEFFVWASPKGGKVVLQDLPNRNDYLSMDYESLVLEEQLSYDWGLRGKLSLSLRYVSYFEGIGDAFIEDFHSLFGFPNAGREYFPQEQLYINIENSSGHDLQLNNSKFSLGDSQLVYQRPIDCRAPWAIAWAGAIKLPTGSLEGLSGSGTPDIGLQLLTLRNHKRWIFHGQLGFVLPFDALIPSDLNVRPFIQNMLGLEYKVQEKISIISQLHLNTSPLTSDIYRPYVLGIGKTYQLLQTNLRLGFKMAYSRGCLQLYVEEDPFTFEGADIIINLGGNYTW